MKGKGPLWAGIWILLLAFMLAACDTTGDTPAGLDSGQFIAGDVSCTDTDPHPIAQSIADQFDVEYDRVMSWFCHGEAFDDILLALQTAELSGRDPEVLLSQSDEGWDNVWANEGTVDPEVAGAELSSDGPFDDQSGDSLNENQGGQDGDDLNEAQGDEHDDGTGLVETADGEFEMTGFVVDKAEAQRVVLVEVAGAGLAVESFMVLVPQGLAFEELQVGDRVKIEGFRESDGGLVAREIEFEDGIDDVRDDADDEGDEDFDDDDQDDDLDDNDADDFDEDQDDDSDDDQDDSDDDDRDGDSDDETQEDFDGNDADNGFGQGLGDDFGDQNGDADEWNGGYYCRNLADEHPVGEGIAEEYDVDYGQVMAWFCESNLGMGEIMLALQTAEATDEPVEVLVQRRLNGEGWGQIWQDLGLIGRPEEAGPSSNRRGPGNGDDNPGRGNSGTPPGQQKDKDNPGKDNNGAPPGQQKNK